MIGTALPLADYLSDPAPSPSLSSSIAHLLVTRSPQHAWYAHPRLNPTWTPAEATEQTDFGSIAHALLLEPKTAMGRIAIVYADDWRKGYAKTQRDAAREDGKYPVLEERLATATAMVEAARRAIMVSEEMARVFTDGEAERTLIWAEDDDIGLVGNRRTWFRSRPDWLTNDHEIIVDYKTTSASAEPTAFGRMILTMGYHLQAALAIRGVKALSGIEPAFIFMAQETDPPYAVSFIGLSPTFLAFAASQLDYAVRLWRNCLAANGWPAYPSRVAWIEPPGWATFQWEEGLIGR